ncbi:TerB family tellurite resistance protein [Helicobacter sp. 11S02629-2]|uniref:TerB family tellurite resistance protein n=1 Tax=Helicobacter sp. 11S02629-2 TaxID=1476195 RepID=UPI000BA6B519|nr:TerB family tellurite resistance protein [Helicobacter sp. 11S02629-2]PAF44961.1 hypothetical protein BKH40_04550 [Helicobacter sp. 11S02629-2]
MEIVLVIIAAAVIYYLYTTFQNYLKNPLNQNPQTANAKKDDYEEYTDPYVEEDPMAKLRASEYGVLIALLGKLSMVDGSASKLEYALVKKVIKYILEEKLDLTQYELDELENSYLEIYHSPGTLSIEDLSEQYLTLTKGEYRKRIKVVELLFAMGYADGILDAKEKDMIIDIAAYFEIENSDFNKIYDDFEASYKDTKKPSLQEALSFLGLSSNYTKKELDDAYDVKLDSINHNILNAKNFNKSYIENDGKNVILLEESYKALDIALKNQASQNQTSQNQNAEEDKLATSDNIKLLEPAK